MHLFQPWLDDQWHLKYFYWYITSFSPQFPKWLFRTPNWLPASPTLTKLPPNSWAQVSLIFSKAHPSTYLWKTHFLHFLQDFILSFIFPFPGVFNLSSLQPPDTLKSFLIKTILPKSKSSSSHHHTSTSLHTTMLLHSPPLVFHSHFSSNHCHLPLLPMLHVRCPSKANCDSFSSTSSGFFSHYLDYSIPFCPASPRLGSLDSMGPSCCFSLFISPLVFFPGSSLLSSLLTCWCSPGYWPPPSILIWALSLSFFSTLSLGNLIYTHSSYYILCLDDSSLYLQEKPLVGNSRSKFPSANLMSQVPPTQQVQLRTHLSSPRTKPAHLLMFLLFVIGSSQN